MNTQDLSQRFPLASSTLIPFLDNLLRSDCSELNGRETNDYRGSIKSRLETFGFTFLPTGMVSVRHKRKVFNLPKCSVGYGDITQHYIVQRKNLRNAALVDIEKAFELYESVLRSK